MIMHPSRYLFFACLGFIGGVGAQSVFLFSDMVPLMGFAAAAACAMYAFRQKRFLVHAFVLGAFCAGAAIYGDAHAAWLGQRVVFLALSEKKYATVHATVASRESLAGAKRYVLERIISEDDGAPLPRMRLHLVDVGAHAYIPGDRIIIRNARFDTTEAFTPFLKRDGVAGAIAFPKELALEEKTCAEHRWSVSCFSYAFTAALTQAREVFERSLRASLSEPYSALADGLLLGGRTNLSADVKESFRYLGLSHIVAVSGYNITILVLAVSTLLGFFAVSRRASFWIASVFLALFALLTGGSASVVRASVMGFLVILAQHASRMYSARIAIALAGTLMLFQNPFLLRYDAGFVLSFLATAGLLVFYPLLEERAKHLPKLGPVKEVVLQTLSAQAFVLPVLIFAFGSVPLLFLVSNMLVLPAIPPTMFFAFVGGVAGFFGETAGRVAMLPAYALLAWELGVVDVLAKIPHAQALIISPFLRWVFSIGVGACVGLVTWKLRLYRYSTKRP